MSDRGQSSLFRQIVLVYRASQNPPYANDRQKAYP